MVVYYISEYVLCYNYKGDLKMLKVILKDKYVLIMLAMVITMFIGYKVSDYQHQQAVQQQKIHEQGQKAKFNTQWKLDHHNGEIPAYKD